MQLCTFALTADQPRQYRAGLLKDGRIYELAGPTTLSAILESQTELENLKASGSGHEWEGIVLHAPIPRPGKIVAAIVNTRGMLGGSDVELDRPRLDMKAPSIVIGPGEIIQAPPSGIRPEVELAAIVGKRISKASTDAAARAIFGYTILNDVTAPSDSRDDAYEAYRRDRTTGEIRKTTLRGPLFRSKNHDTFCPMGPWIVTTDEIQDWSRLRMTTKFDETMIQEGSTAEYIFGPAELASYVSQFLTLEPGDVVSCGSVGWTRDALGKLDPTEFVLPKRRGTLELEIEGVGKLRNPVSQPP